MRIPLLCTISLVLLIACQTQTPPQPPVQLFNGKDLSGWSIQNNGQFSVENGLLKINRGAGWLRSDKTYSDFVLTMEFRFLEKDANSGIFIRTDAISKDDENGWPARGYQVQCKDTFESVALAHLVPHEAYGAPPYRAQSNMDALKRAYKPHGEWHEYQIKAQGDKLWVKLNGYLITEAEQISIPSGHVGLQGEFGLLEFRKIEILEL